jgi:hypothetical protein
MRRLLDQSAGTLLGFVGGMLFSGGLYSWIFTTASGNAAHGNDYSPGLMSIVLGLLMLAVGLRHRPMTVLPESEQADIVQKSTGQNSPNIVGDDNEAM